MAADEHTVHYELQAADNWTLTLYLFRSSPRYWVLHGVLVLGVAWLAASMRGIEYGTGAFDLRLFFGVALFMAVFDYVVQRLKSVHRVRRTVGLVGPHELRITADGLYGKTEGLESHITWARVHRVVETDAWLYLFLNRTSAVIVPRAAFSGDAAREDFLSAANSWLAAAS